MLVLLLIEIVQFDTPGTAMVFPFYTGDNTIEVETQLTAAELETYYPNSRPDSRADLAQTMLMQQLQREVSLKSIMGDFIENLWRALSHDLSRGGWRYNR